MRLATYEAATGDVQGAQPVEIAVTAFPGDAGGLAPNVNRWRKQIGLTPLSQEQLSDHLKAYANGRLKGYTLDMTGDGGEDRAAKRIIGAIISDGAGKTWFVKAMDNATALEPHRDAIIQFARSFVPAGIAHNRGNQHGQEQPE